MKTSSLFERSRKRIIAAIMAVLVVLFVVTLAAIYAFSYAEVYERNVRMLDSYAMGYQEDRMPFGIMRPDGTFQRGLDKPRANALFHAVLFDVGGMPIAVENASMGEYTNDELIALAEDALARNARNGFEGSFIYAIESTPVYTLVAFMDNTLVAESMGTLFRYTLIIGLALLVILFFVARWLAGRIVRPMQQAYEAQRRFISDAGHELKTPVAVMEANAELLQREVGDNLWLANIRHENAQMGSLVSQLLELARTEGQTMVRETVDLSRVVEAEALSYEARAFEEGRTLDCKIAEGIEVMGNAPELSRLVSILLDNALSHGAPGADVSLSLARVGSSARIAVSNAIAAEDAGKLAHANLFERFSRGDEARTSDPGDASGAHYGLGLAIARAIVETHGGTIDASVDGQRAFVTFTANLPVKK